MFLAALDTKEVKPVSADHMMVRHSVPETIFQARQQEALGQEQELGFAARPKCGRGTVSHHVSPLSTETYPGCCRVQDSVRRPCVLAGPAYQKHQLQQALIRQATMRHLNLTLEIHSCSFPNPRLFTSLRKNKEIHLPPLREGTCSR